MTGGIGFSRLGQNSFRENRELLKKRMLMKENPYHSKSPEPSGLSNEAYDEIKEWKIKYRRKAKMLKLSIYLGLFITVTVIVILIYIWNE